MNKIAILLGAILVAGTVAPFVPVYASHTGSHIYDILSGEQLQDGSIVYVDASSGSPEVGFEIVKSSAAEVIPSELPPGAQLVFISPTSLFFSWSISNLSDDVALPVTYGVTFTTIHPGANLPETKSILIVVETETAPVSVAFDRTGYKTGDSARITVTDTRANTNDFIQNEIPVTVRIDSAPPSTITLVESLEEPGQFVGTYDVPSGQMIRVNYKGQQARANIGLAMSLEDTKYEVGEVTQLEVTDMSKAGNGFIDRIRIELTSDSSSSRIGVDEQGDTGAFQVAIRPSTSTGLVAGVQRIAADVGDTVTATYRNQVVTASVIEPKFDFDREWYANLEYATITVVDKDMNLNRYARDTIPVQVTSDSDSTPIINMLIESGPDTATFHSYYMIWIVDDAQLASNNPHAVRAVDGDNIRATYSGKVAETLAGIPGPVAALPVPDNLDGVGESGSSANDAEIIFPDITNLSCAAYGDTDKDGICNNMESGGYMKATYGGQTHTFTESCSPCPSRTKADIYIEVDYDASVASYPADLSTALNNVKGVFAVAPVPGTAGVVLHYIIDDAITLPENVKIWSDDSSAPTPEMDSYTEVKEEYLGTTTAWSDNKVKAWHNLVHYALVIKKQAHDPGASGIAEVVGDDMVISLGSFANSVDQLQGTFMHELGHNLGLDHGGGLEVFPPLPGPPETYDWYDDSDVNCKPNYPSVMSYDRQFTNMFTGNTLAYSAGLLTVNGAAEAPLNINGLNENHGVRPPSGSSVTIVYGVDNPDPITGDPYYDINSAIGPGNPVNFPRIPIVKTVTYDSYAVNWNNDIDSTDASVSNTITDISILRCDAVNNPVPAGVLLKDHNDWNRIIMDFRKYNPDSLATGSRIMSSGISGIGWELQKVHGVADLDRAIQDLDDDHFSFEGEDEILGDSSLVLDFAGSAIDFSRTSLPIPPLPNSATADLVGDTVFTTLTVIDPDKNVASNTEDSIPFAFGMGNGQFTIEVAGDGFSVVVDSMADYTGAGCLTFNGLCPDDILPALPDLDETGDSTGVFDDAVGFVNPGLDTSDWQDLEVAFTYHDADGDQESATVIFTGNDGELNVHPSSANAGTILTISIEDNDLNLDDEEVEEFESSIVAKGDALLTVETKNDAIGGVDTETFTETGVNTGIFTAEFEVGDDIPIMDGGTNATSILITYNDEIDSVGEEGDEQEISIPIGSGGSGLNKQELHNILMVEDDSDPSVAANVQRFGNPAEAVNQLESILLGVDSTIGGAPGNDWLSAKGQMTITPKVLRLLATLKLVELNEPYLPGTKTFELTSHHGNKVYTITVEADTISPVAHTFALDTVAKQVEFFVIGEGDMTITVPASISDAFNKVTMSGGKVIAFEEVSANSTHTTYLLKDIPYYGGVEGISMSYGSTVPGLTWPVGVAPVVPKSISGDTLVTVTQSIQVVLSATIKNTLTVAQPFVAVVEVRDEAGITVFLAWQTGVLNANSETEVGLSWTPEESGDYEARVLTLSSITSPQILSEIARSNIVVVEDTGRGGGGTVPLGGGSGGSCMHVVCP